MGDDLSALRYGRIIYTWMADHHGHGKLRPAVVLTPDHQIAADQKIVVAAITTTFTDPPPHYCVKLPWHPNGTTSTKLRSRSAAVANWLAVISDSDVVGYGGDVPKKHLAQIQRLIDELSID